MELILSLLIIIIPLVAGLFIKFNRNLVNDDINLIKIFTSLVILIFSIYLLYVYYVTSESILLDLSLDIPTRYENLSNGKIQFVGVNSCNLIILIAVAVASFCLSLYPSFYIDPNKLAKAMFMKSSALALILSMNFLLFSVALICFIYCFCIMETDLQARKRKFIFPGISIACIIIASILFYFGNSFLKNSSLYSTIFFFIIAASIILTGVPYADSWIIDSDVKDGEDIFKISIAIKLGLIIVIKLIAAYPLEFRTFYPLIIIVCVVALLFKIIEVFKDKNHIKTCVNYSIIHSYAIIISFSIPSETIYISSIISLFACIITVSALMYAFLLENHYKAENFNIAPLIITSALSAIFLPGTASFVPYLLILYSAMYKASFFPLILFLLMPILTELYLYKLISPLISYKLTDDMPKKEIPFMDKTGLILLNFVSIAVGIAPALIMRPLSLL